MTKTAEYAYMATAPCGCTYAISTVLTEDMAKDARNGAVIDRVLVETARKNWVTECSHTPEWGGLA